MILWRRFVLTRAAVVVWRSCPDRDRRRCVPPHPFRTANQSADRVAARLRPARPRRQRRAGGRARRPAGVRRRRPGRGVLVRQDRGGRCRSATDGLTALREAAGAGARTAIDAGDGDGHRVLGHRQARARLPEVGPAADGRRRHLHGRQRRGGHRGAADRDRAAGAASGGRRRRGRASANSRSLTAGAAAGIVALVVLLLIPVPRAGGRRAPADTGLSIRPGRRRGDRRARRRRRRRRSGAADRRTRRARC